MKIPSIAALRARPLQWIERACALCLYGVAIWLATRVGLAALRSGLGLHVLPRPLATLDHRLPIVFRLHMLGCGFALLLLPWTLLVRRHRTVHRWLGRIAAGAMLLGIAAAVPSALASGASPLARAGFLVQGLLCLGLLVAALVAVATGRLARHRRSMAYVAALLAGAVVLRFMVMAVILRHWPFTPAYAAIAWLSWLLPLALVWLWPRLAGRFSRSARS